MSILPDSSVQILNDTTFSSTILPVNDFYGYVNQEWIDKTTIPDDYTSWGVTEALHKKTSMVGVCWSCSNFDYRNSTNYRRLCKPRSFIN